MLSFIAIFAPAIIATSFFDHIQEKKLPIRELVYVYTKFLVFINLISYTLFLFVLHYRRITFSDVFALKFASLATFIGLILTVILSLVNFKLSIKVKKDDKENPKKKKN